MIKKKYYPFILSLIVVLADQISKALVVAFIPEGTIFKSYFNDWLWIVHVRNDAVAFSMGDALPVFLKYILFVAFPLLLMVAVAYCILSDKSKDEFTCFQKWCLAGIFGGGMGNIADRLFRGLRVVDFVSTDLNGFMGMDRFPTWNIADASVVCSVILLMISFIIGERRKNGKES